MTPLRRVPLHCAEAVVLAAMVVAVYGQVGSFPFVYCDDDPFIFRNPALQGGLSVEAVRWAFTTWKEIGWLPLTWLSHLLDVTLFGMDAGKHHLVNVLFHLLNTLLLFRVLREATGRAWESALVAALFAIHPLHVESVAWVSERKNLLCTFFFFLSLWAYVRYAARPGAGMYLAVVLFFLLGLLSKPMVVTLPFVLLLLDYWPLGRCSVPRDPPSRDPPRFRRFPPGRLLLEKVPMLLLSAVFCGITYLTQEWMGAMHTLRANPLGSRVANGAHAYATYLRKAVWPSDLAVFYPHTGEGPAMMNVAAAGLLLCLVTALVVRQAPRRRWLAVGWFWYLGTLVPVIGLVQVGGQSMADRYTYIPLIGVFLAAAWGLAECAERWKVPNAATAVAAAAWLAALLACAWVQTGYWRGTAPLFERAIEVTKDNWMAHNNLGVYLAEHGRTDEAVARFREALRILPDYTEAHHNLGVALLGKGELAEAADHFRATLRLLPGSAEAHNNLGVVLARQGAFPEAASHFREALRLKPDYAEALENMERVLADVGEARPGGTP